MKQTHWLHLHWIGPVAGLVVLLAAGLHAPADEQGPPAVAAATPVSATPTEALADGLEHARAGRFAKSYQVIRQAARAAPNNRKLVTAQELLEAYIAQSSLVDAERKEDYRNAVRRVQWYRIAQEHLPVLAEAKIDQKLRDAVEKVMDAGDKAASSSELKEADKVKAGELKAKAAKALRDTADQVEAALKLVSADDSTYGQTLRGVGDELMGHLLEYREAWRGVQVDTPAQRRVGAAKLAKIEREVSRSMGDLEAMTSETPWRHAIRQATLARVLCEDTDALAKELWYLRLLSDLEARGRDLVVQAEKTADDGKDLWYKALSAYSGLQVLSPHNEKYRKTHKVVLRHVRVLSLYGPEPTTKPAKEEPHWRKLVENVDADIVDRAVRYVGARYVTKVNFREVALAGLQSVRILAETPQTSRAFPHLADAEKRDAFLRALEEAARHIRKKDRIDADDVMITLNDLLEAADRAVPDGDDDEERTLFAPGVLEVEFADGLLGELDRFTSMIWPYNVSRFNKDTRGKFTGVGIQITKSPGEPLRVVTPLAGSPAHRAGIKKNDLIVEVNGTETKELSIDKLVDMIMGKKGTKVVLTIKREGLLKPLAIAVTRDQILIVTIKGWHRKARTGEWSYRLDADRTVGYIRLTQFTEDTSAKLAKALKGLRTDGVKSIVLDMRFNPGGLLGEAIRVVDQFIAEGRIVSTRGRRALPRTRDASSGGDFLKGSVAILINEQSASAAEIVSGALKDHGRAVIVGQRSYGKGSVQNVIPIRRPSAALKLTTAYYYLPSGRLLHKRDGARNWGVDPDAEVPLTPHQTRRWLELQRDTDLLQDDDASDAELSRQLSEQYDADVQLRAAVLLLRLGRLAKG